MNTVYNGVPIALALVVGLGFAALLGLVVVRVAYKPVFFAPR